jgi:hypothetical protein
MIGGGASSQSLGEAVTQRLLVLVAGLAMVIQPTAPHAQAAAPPDQAKRAQILTSQGLGPVRVGMTVRQAGMALGTKLKVDTDGDSDACRYAWRADGLDENVAYMVEDGRITRIDIFHPDKTTHPELSVVTTAGIGLGSSEESVRRAYRKSVKVKPSFYADNGLEFRVKDFRKQRGLLFAVDEGKVVHIRAGRIPSIDYVEGCE